MSTQQGGIFTADASAYLRQGGEVEVEELAQNVWTASSGSYRTLFFAGESSVYAVNTLATPAAARGLAAAIAATVPGKELAGLIATIDHLDHSGWCRDLGNPPLVIAHALAAHVIRERGATGQQPVTRVIGGTGETLELDGLTVELSYPGPTMGTGNLAVFLPDSHVLFLVGPQANARYGIFPDFHFRHVTRIWRNLADRDIQTVVPGRYRVMGVAELRRAADYLDALDVACQTAFAQGVPIWEVDTMGQFVGGHLRDTFGDLDGFDEHVAAAAIRIVHHYVMGGWGLEDTIHPELLLKYAR